LTRRATLIFPDTGWVDKGWRRKAKRVIKRDAIAQKYGLSARQAIAVGHLLESPVLRIEDYEKLCPGTRAVVGPRQGFEI